MSDQIKKGDEVT